MCGKVRERRRAAGRYDHTLIPVGTRVGEHEREEPIRCVIERYLGTRRDGTFDGCVCSVRGRRNVCVPCDVDEDLEAGGDGHRLRRAVGRCRYRARDVVEGDGLDTETGGGCERDGAGGHERCFTESAQCDSVGRKIGSGCAAFARAKMENKRPRPALPVHVLPTVLRALTRPWPALPLPLLLSPPQQRSGTRSLRFPPSSHLPPWPLHLKYHPATRSRHPSDSVHPHFSPSTHFHHH